MPRADPRVGEILTLIQRVAGGDLQARLNPSEAKDDLDAIAEGLNMLAEELEGSTVSVEVYEAKALELEKTVQELGEAQRRLRLLADLGPLTLLPNRRVFDDRLRMALRSCRRAKRRAAVLYLDIDGFKPVNDRYGHAAGDKVLIEVGRCLQQCARETDSASRLGGDEFALILDPGPSTEETAAIAERLLGAIRTPIDVNGASIDVDASIGIAFFPDDAEDAAELVEAADAAMYRNKQDPRSVFFAGDCPRD